MELAVKVICSFGRFFPLLNLSLVRLNQMGFCHYVSIDKMLFWCMHRYSSWQKKVLDSTVNRKEDIYLL